MRISDWSSDVCSSDLRNNGNARFDQIVPVLDTLGIAVANEKYDCRCIGPAVFRQALLPALVQRVGLRGNLIDVVSQGQGDRKSAVQAKSVSVRVDPGGTRLLKKKKTPHTSQHP